MANPESQLFVRIAGETRGPYNLSQLQQLAQVAVVLPATPASLAASGPWLTLGDLEQAGLIFSARTKLNFKNAPAEPPTAELPLEHTRDWAELAERPLRPMVAAALARLPAATSRTALENNEILQMVTAVAELEADHAPALPRRKKRGLSTTFKVLFCAAVMGDLVLYAIPAHYDSLHDSLSMMIIGGWAVLYNGGMVYLYVLISRTGL